MGARKNETKQTYIQTLEQLIINHSKAKSVNSSGTSGSATSAAHTQQGKDFQEFLILPDSLA